jgi:hypothetical protein
MKIKELRKPKKSKWNKKQQAKENAKENAKPKFNVASNNV